MLDSRDVAQGVASGAVGPSTMPVMTLPIFGCYNVIPPGQEEF